MDRYPIKEVLFITLGLSLISFAIFIYTNVFWLGVLARLLIGCNSAFAFIAALYIARRYVAEKLFTAITGLTIALGTISAALAQCAIANFIHDYRNRSRH